MLSGMIMLVLLVLILVLLIDALFPDAIEANKTRMEEVMKKVEQVRGMTSGSSSSTSGQTGIFIYEICHWIDLLKNAVESLPELMEQKKELEKHTTILKGKLIKELHVL